RRGANEGPLLVEVKFKRIAKRRLVVSGTPHHDRMSVAHQGQDSLDANNHLFILEGVDPTLEIVNGFSKLFPRDLGIKVVVNLLHPADEMIEIIAPALLP